MKVSKTALSMAALSGVSGALAFVPASSLAITRSSGSQLATRRSIQRSTVRMQFWKSPGPDPSTNLAKEPPLDKMKSDAEYKATMDPVAYSVLRQKATEPRSVTVARGGFDDHTEDGTYVCGCCGTPLYDSSHKFDCGCGWPGFWTNIKDAVYEERDKDGFRAEILCSSCGGHLGHVFRGEGFSNPPPNERHCVNSVSIGFIPRGKGPEDVQKCTYSGPVYGA